MSATYFTLLTTTGESALATATAQGSPLHLTQMAVGDGNGNLPTPETSQTRLINERRRAPLNTLSIDPNNPNQIIAEQVLPEDVGGWWIREIGLYDEHDRLIAVGNCPPTYKPQLIEGSGRTQIIRMVLIVSHTENVELKIDPAVVLATRQYVDESLTRHAQSRNHPDATLTAKGFTQLSSATNSISETLAATPKAVKAVMDKASNHTHPWSQITAVPDGTTEQKGIVKLNSTTNSASTTEAATPSAVKAAMDKASNHTHPWSQITAVPDGTTDQKGIVKLNNTTNSASTTEAATPSAVKAAMEKASNHTHPWSQITAIPDGTTTQKGIVKLNTATNSTSTTEAATPGAVKSAYDLATGKLGKTERAVDSSKLEGATKQQVIDTARSGLYVSGTPLWWGEVTDFAGIDFLTTTDEATSNRLEFQVGDNGNEYFSWASRNGTNWSYWMNLNGGVLTVQRYVLNHVQDIRLGAVQSVAAWRGPGYGDTAGYVLTGAINSNKDDLIDTLTRRPIQKQINGVWYTVSSI
ncbi:TPA: phage tail protein [Escherichia coli]|nr:phage tail protein [Escherichia coli]EEX0352886.1 phage tail protein [Escherichia coli]EGD4731753.1 phage tail protein [Escherichia coli]EGD5076134.1 phage tail protein [Escherichia coli]MKP37329.1 phage tail protein [Escherichia coli]